MKFVKHLIREQMGNKDDVYKIQMSKWESDPLWKMSYDLMTQIDNYFPWRIKISL